MLNALDFIYNFEKKQNGNSKMQLALRKNIEKEKRNI
jgi:hypothetical protein